MGSIYQVDTYICSGYTIYVVDYIILYCGYTGYVVGTSNIKWDTLYIVCNLYLVGTHIISWGHILWGTYVVDNTIYRGPHIIIL